MKDKYSVTTDVQSFQLCPRQYGFLKVQGYKPSHSPEMWYGTILHQVLDKLHNQYLGHIDPEQKEKIPTDNDVEKYFNQVEMGLKAKRVVFLGQDIKKDALVILKKFNQILGPKFYPKVIDTEFTLETDFGSYILHGVVDVLRANPSAADKGDYAPVEIWDYKGTSFPDTKIDQGQQEYEKNRYQLLIYADLYREKVGRLPLKAKIFYLNELLADNASESWENYFLDIDFRTPETRNKIESVKEDFSKTVNEIRRCKELHQWNPPRPMLHPKSCVICDFRYNCDGPSIAQKRMKYP